MVERSLFKPNMKRNLDKMKTFREQIAEILLKKYNEIDESKLNESSTQAAETLMTYIRQWNAESRNHALCNMFERRQWKDGRLGCGNIKMNLAIIGLPKTLIRFLFLDGYWFQFIYHQNKGFQKI